MTSTLEENETSDDVVMKVFLIMSWLPYGAILLIALLGNPRLMYFVKTHPNFGKPISVLMLNIFTCDTLTAAAYIIDVTALLLQRWPFPSSFCKLYGFTNLCTTLATRYSMACVAVYRSKLILSPFAVPTRKRTLAGIVVTIWVFSIAVAAAFTNFYQMQISEPGNGTIGDAECVEILDEGNSLLISIATFIVFTGIPFIVTFYQYLKVFCRLNGYTFPGESGPTPRLTADRRNVLLMSITVVITYVVCVLPLALLQIAMDVSDIENHRYFLMVYITFDILFDAHVAANFFIYFKLQSEFREHIISDVARIQNFFRRFRRAPRNENIPLPQLV